MKDVNMLYKDRRANISLTGGPVILTLDTPLGVVELCCTYNGIIFNKGTLQEIKDVVNSQIEVLQSKENGVMTVISLPWVDSSKEGYYTNASPKTLRVPQGFGEGVLPSEIYIANPNTKDYIKLYMLHDLTNDTLALYDKEDDYLNVDKFSRFDKHFIYNIVGKKLKVYVNGADEFIELMENTIGGNWFMPFMNYAVNEDSIGKSITIHSADELDSITLISEKHEDKHHIYMGNNNYREFESIPDSFVLDNYVDGTIHYARKRDYLAVLLTNNKMIEYALVYNGTDTRFTTSHTRRDLTDKTGTPVDLRDYAYGKKLPTLKEAIDELIKNHRQHKLFAKEGCTISDINEIQKHKSKINRRGKFPTLSSIFGNKK